MHKPEKKTEQTLPPEPEEPHMDDCCGGGCCPCIWDIYYDKITRWREAKLKQEEQNSHTKPTGNTD